MFLRNTLLSFFIIIFSGAFIQGNAFSPEKVREYFEWGEYSKLLDDLKPLLSNNIPDTTDPKEFAQYFIYAGVAFFGLGGIGEAREMFLKALFYDENSTLDRNYVTEEMISLFRTTRSEYNDRKKDIHYQDSLSLARQTAYESNLVRIKEEALRRRKSNSSFFAGTFYIFSAAFLSAVMIEYFEMKQPYDEFREAARMGDRETYNRIRPAIKQANTIISVCAIVSGVCLSSGIYFTFNIRKLNRK